MGLRIDTEDYCIRKHEKIKLKDRPTSVKPVYSSKDEYVELLQGHTEQLCLLQDKLYASDSYSLLIVFQALDAAGKDGAIKHVLSGVNPQGCQVFSFKQPSLAELQHDFLWRTNQCLPERGRIGIFNRSYYEEVLVVRVHPELLHGEGLSPESGGDKAFWEERYRSISDMEKHLYRNGTRIVKFFLHVSREEQRKRLLARIDDPAKNWKFNDADVAERKLWDEYHDAYSECIGSTAADEAPWYIVPADDKKNARLIVSQVIVDMMNSLHLEYPKTDKARRKQLLTIRKSLLK